MKSLHTGKLPDGVRLALSSLKCLQEEWGCLPRLPSLLLCRLRDKAPSLIPRAQGLRPHRSWNAPQGLLESEVTDFAGIFCLVGDGAGRAAQTMVNKNGSHHAVAP